ncbi:MAG: hypothetical protein ABI134_21630 [Byssovorax sp.]
MTASRASRPSPPPRRSGPRALAGALLAAAALGSTGCIEENAYLELELVFPPDPRATSGTDSRQAVVRVNTGDVSFEEDWESSEALSPVQLDPKQPKKLQISVEGRAEIETKPVRIKVRFCTDPSCVGIHDDTAPEVRFEIERAFYLGKRTSLTLAAECIPNVATETDPPPVCAARNESVSTIPKCSVAGCREGVTTNYCASDKHFCEE